LRVLNVLKRNLLKLLNDYPRKIRYEGGCVPTVHRGKNNFRERSFFEYPRVRSPIFSFPFRTLNVVITYNIYIYVYKGAAYPEFLRIFATTLNPCRTEVSILHIFCHRRLVTGRWSRNLSTISIIFFKCHSKTYYPARKPTMKGIAL